MASRWLAPAGALLLCLLASCGERGPVGPAGPSFGLTDPTVEPRVVSTYPANGSSGPFELFTPGSYLEPHFVLELNKLVSRAEFNQNWIRVEGFDKPVRLILLETYRFPDEARKSSGDLLTNVLSVGVIDAVGFRSRPYEIGQTYTVTVDTALVDFSGRHPSRPHRFSFIPEPHFRVSSAVPAHEVPVAVSSPVYVFFNSEVDSTILSACQISPAISGTWVLVPQDRRGVLFRHFEPFPFGSEYTVSIQEHAADAQGHRLQRAFTSTFQVQQFAVTGVTPVDGATEIVPESAISVFANARIDPATVTDAFQIEPSIAGNLNFGIDWFNFTPVNVLAFDTTYRVTISTRLRASDGTALASPYVFSFKTDRFRVLGTSPADGDLEMNRFGSIGVYCTGPIDFTSAAVAFSISPAVPGGFAQYSEGSHLVFSPSQPLAPNTVYTFRLSGDLRSLSGVRLGSPCTIVFKTGQS